MKNLITSLILIGALQTGFAQTAANKYGPLPFHAITETIGENYVVLASRADERMSVFEHEDNIETIYIKDIKGKILKLISLDDRYGHFLSTTNEKYKVLRADNKQTLPELVFIKDIDTCKKLFLNKTLWYKGGELRIFNGTADKKVYYVSKFSPLKVTDVSASTYYDVPVRFTLKTSTGEIILVDVDVSGTNTSKDPDFLFDNFFYTTDPHLTYKFSPAVWKQIENLETPIGMSTAAFELVKGRPTKVNSSRTGNTFREQWVYGIESPRYYYFTNGRYTGYN